MEKVETVHNTYAVTALDMASKTIVFGSEAGNILYAQNMYLYRLFTDGSKEYHKKANER